MEHRKCFVVQGPAMALLPLHGKGVRQLPAAMAAWLSALLPLAPGMELSVRDAFPLGGRNGQQRYFFSVPALAHADSIVRLRCSLKGTGVVIRDHLSPAEKELHGALWSTFQAARAAGHSAQFHRARLFVYKPHADGTVRRIEVLACPT